jgi:hypothetical protein
MSDWTTAFDCLLTQRLPSACARCGVRDGQGWVELVDLGTIAVATVVCRRCKADDPRRDKLYRLLAQRCAGWHQQKEENNDHSRTRPIDLGSLAPSWMQGV